MAAAFGLGPGAVAGAGSFSSSVSKERSAVLSHDRDILSRDRDAVYSRDREYYNTKVRALQSFIHSPKNLVFSNCMTISAACTPSPSPRSPRPPCRPYRPCRPCPSPPAPS